MKSDRSRFGAPAITLLLIIAVVIGVALSNYAEDLNRNPSHNHTTSGDLFEKELEPHSEAANVGPGGTLDRSPTTAAAEEENPIWFTGKIELPGEATAYPYPLETIEVFAKLKDFPAPPSNARREGQYLAFPVSELGNFKIRANGCPDEVSFGAVGKGCVAVADIPIQVGVATSIPMTFVYGVSATLVDEQNLQEITNGVFWVGKYTNLQAASGSSKGIKGSISRKVFHQKLRETKHGKFPIRRLATSQEFFENGLAAEVNCEVAGYQSLKKEIPMTLAVSSLEQLQIPLSRIDGPWNSIRLNNQRPKVWGEVQNYDYFSQAKFLLQEDGENRFPIVKRNVGLLSDPIELQGIPLQNFHLYVELSTEQGLIPNYFPGSLVNINLTRDQTDADLFHGSMEAIDVAALAIPPTPPDESGHAWIGLRLRGANTISGQRYNAKNGCVIDGLLPGSYEIFWSGVSTRNGHEFRQMQKENKPTTEVALVAGLNKLEL